MSGPAGLSTGCGIGQSGFQCCKFTDYFRDGGRGGAKIITKCHDKVDKWAKCTHWVDFMRSTPLDYDVSNCQRSFVAERHIWFCVLTRWTPGRRVRCGGVRCSPTGFFLKLNWIFFETQLGSIFVLIWAPRCPTTLHPRVANSQLPLRFTFSPRCPHTAFALRFIPLLVKSQRKDRANFHSLQIFFRVKGQKRVS